MRRILMCVLCVCSCASSPQISDSLIESTPVASDVPLSWDQSGVGVLRMHGPGREVVALKGLDVRVQIQGRRVETALVHHFDESTKGQVDFFLSIPPGAFVQSVELGSRRQMRNPGWGFIQGEVEPLTGRAWLGDRTLRTSMNMESGDAVVSVVYSQLLDTVEGRGTYTLALPKLPQTTLPFSLILESSHRVESTDSTYKVHVARSESSASWIAKHSHSKFSPRGPLTLNVHPLRTAAQTTLGSRRIFHRDIVMPTSVHPRKGAQRYLFVLDTSSGHEESVQQAAQVARHMIQKAPEGTTFGVITGAASPEVCGINLDAAKARACLEDLQALGGSNMDGLLKVASEQAAKMSASSQPVEVFLLSDGLATFGELRRARLMARVRQGFADAKLTLHTIVMGQVVAAEEMSQWSILGGGVSVRMAPQDFPRSIAWRMHTYLRKQGVRRLRARVVDGEVASLALEQRPWTAPGQMLALFGDLRSDQAKVEISGVHPDGTEWSTHVYLQTPRAISPRSLAKERYGLPVVDWYGSPDYSAILQWRWASYWAIAVMEQLDREGASYLKQREHAQRTLRAQPFAMMRAWRTANQPQREGNLVPLHPEENLPRASPPPRMRPLGIRSKDHPLGAIRPGGLGVIDTSGIRPKTKPKKLRARSEYKIKMKGCSDQKNVEDTLKRRAKSFQYCYEKSFQGKKARSYKGKMRLTLSVHKYGRISDIASVPSKSGRAWESVDQCIQRSARRLRFRMQGETCKVWVSFAFDMVDPIKDDRNKVRALMRQKTHTTQEHTEIFRLLVALQDERGARAWMKRLLKKTPDALHMDLFRAKPVAALFPKEHLRATLRVFVRDPQQHIGLLTRMFEESPMELARVLAKYPLEGSAAAEGLHGVLVHEKAFQTLWSVWSPRFTPRQRVELLHHTLRMASLDGFTPKHAQSMLRTALEQWTKSADAKPVDHREFITLSLTMGHPQTRASLQNFCGGGAQALGWCLHTLERLGLPASQAKEMADAWIERRKPVLQAAIKQHSSPELRLEAAMLSMRQGNKTQGLNELSGLMAKDFKNAALWMQYTDALDVVDPVLACQQRLSLLQMFPKMSITYADIDRARTTHRQHAKALTQCQEQAAMILGYRFDRMVIVLKETQDSSLLVDTSVVVQDLSESYEKQVFGLPKTGSPEYDNGAIRFIYEKGPDVRGEVVLLDGLWSGEPRVVRKAFHLNKDKPVIRVRFGDK